MSDGSLFGLDNLPYGVFSPAGGTPRVGVRLGDDVVDLSVLLDDAVIDNAVFAAPSLNAFMAQGRDRWTRVREQITQSLAGDLPSGAVHPLADVRMHLPFDVADYVDFYASEHHASNLGRLFRPDAEPLMPNWKHLPVGYHGRAGTVVVSGTDIVRPSGQRKAPDEAAPTYGPSRRLDIEAELGFVVGVGSALGGRIGVDEFADHVFGAVLVNDWSARDVQAWEYVPLGPHLGKSFATSSPRGSCRWPRWRRRVCHCPARTRNPSPTCAGPRTGASTSSSSWSGTARRSPAPGTATCTGRPRRCSPT